MHKGTYKVPLEAVIITLSVSQCYYPWDIKDNVNVVRLCSARLSHETVVASRLITCPRVISYSNEPNPLKQISLIHRTICQLAAFTTTFWSSAVALCPHIYWLYLFIRQIMSRVDADAGHPEDWSRRKVLLMVFDSGPLEPRDDLEVVFSLTLSNGGLMILELLGVVR
jgi:hypothetical protein